VFRYFVQYSNFLYVLDFPRKDFQNVVQNPNKKDYLDVENMAKHRIYLIRIRNSILPEDYVSLIKAS
jgi:hypothetical protein